MATKEANIALTVNGDTSQLRSDLKKGTRALESFEDKAKRMQSQLKKVAIVSVTAGTALTAALYKKQSAIIDRLAKTADAIGETTENLQALRHMGELAGVSSEELDKAIQRMAKGLGEAARKGGAAADALEDIGVSVEDVLKLKPHKQMEVLARALTTVETQAEKASIASDLFGRNGLRMLKVLNQLEDEGLKPTIDSIEAMGASLSRIDAKKVEDANDAVAKAQEAASGLAKELTVALAPVVEDIANAFTDWVKESGGLRNKLEELKPVFNVLVNVGKAMVVIYGAQMAGAFTMYITGTVRAIKANAALVTSMNLTAKAGRILKGVLATLGGPVGILVAVASSFFLFTKEVKQSQVAIKRVTDANYDLTQSFKDLSKVQAAAHIVDVENAMDSLAEKIKATKEGIDLIQSSGGAIIPNDAFQFNTDDLWSDEVLVKAKASLEEMENEFSALNTRLGSLGLQAEFGAFLTIPDEVIEENKAKMLTIEEKQKAFMERKHASQVLYNEKMIKDHKKAISEIEQAEQMSWKTRLSIASNGFSKMFGDISSAMNKENRKQFEIAKMANIAQATIDGITAAVGAYKVGASVGGPLLGASFAGASALATGAMIKQISSQQFGGGASQVSTPASTAPATPQGANAGQTLTVQGLDSGALFSGEAVSDLADRLLDFQRDGGRVVLGA